MNLKSEFDATCPCCHATLVIDTNLRRIVRHEVPASGDKPELSDAHRLVDERGNYSTTVFTREAVRIIENLYVDDATKQAPSLFLYLAHQAVHYPDEVPGHYVDPYRNQTDWTEQRKVYAGMLSAVDESIANVTRALQAKDMWKDTIVVVTTDNGGPTQVSFRQVFA